MARVKIVRPKGSPSPYFWKTDEEGDKERLTVFKNTSDGVKRMRGVYFDSVKLELLRD